MRLSPRLVFLSRRRYMPGYELFGDGVTRSDAPWSGHGLHLDLDRERNVVAQGTF